VLNDCSVDKKPGATVADGSVYLGRPWKAYARVCVQRSSLAGIVAAAGWQIWNIGDERTDHVEFQEYGNSGPGASGTRASFAMKVSSAVSIGTILGSDYKNWVDTSYLS
jgi:pectinesterase